MTASDQLLALLTQIADSPVLVRAGQTLQTEAFLDPSTTSTKVLAVFHLPNNGLTTVLELGGTFTGAELQTSVKFFHLVRP